MIFGQEYLHLPVLKYTKLRWMETHPFSSQYFFEINFQTYWFPGVSFLCIVHKVRKLDSWSGQRDKKCNVTGVPISHAI